IASHSSVCSITLFPAIGTSGLGPPRVTDVIRVLFPAARTTAGGIIERRGNTLTKSETKAGVLRVVIKHLYRLARKLLEVFAAERKLRRNLRCERDDVATARCCLIDAPHFARTRP